MNRPVGPSGQDTSYFAYGAERLSALCRANGLEAEVAEAVELFHLLVAPWGDQPIRRNASGWVSNVADDHTPFEFSVVYGGSRPEVRILVEAQGQPPSLETNWEAGLALSRRLAEWFDLPLDRHDVAAEVLAPAPGATLGIWHAVCLRRDSRPSFKVYFDSQARGRWKASALMEEALVRLGFGRAWPAVRKMGRRGLYLDELRFLSLDLSHAEGARVKAYWRHHDATAADVEQLMRELGPREHRVGDFCRAMAGSPGPYARRPIFSCTTLVDPSSSAPRAATLYLPIVAYTESDRVAVDRIGRYLAAHGLDADRYAATVEQYARRSLDSTASLHSYVSLQQRDGEPQVTVYFSPEAYKVEEAAPVVEAATHRPEPVSAEEIVRRHEKDIVLSDHPFLRRLGREPVALPHLWLIIANFWEAIVSDFPARLAHVVAKVEDDRIRCVIVKQLNDELGEGDYQHAHKPMFRRLLHALEPYRLDGDDDELLAPGRRFGQALHRHLFGDDQYEAVGALMMIEIYGKQTDVRLGAEFRRQDQLDPRALEWLRLHEALEVDHADDSLVLARIVEESGASPQGRAAVWRGADGVVQASMDYFDALYELCYA